MKTDETDINNIDKELSELWHNRDNDWEKELDSSRQLLEKSIIQDYLQGRTGALTIQANCYMRTEQFEKAFSSLGEALSLQSSEIANNWLIHIHFIYGALYRTFGNYDQALEHYLRALSIAKALKNQEEIIHVNDRIAVLHFHLQEYENAIEGFLQTLQYGDIFTDKQQLFSTYLNLSAAYYHQSQSKEAIEAAAMALQIAPSENLSIKAHGNLGSAYLIDDNYEKAKYHLERSFNMSMESDNQVTQCVCRIDFADYLLKIGSDEKAKEMLLNALSTSLTIDFRDSEKDCYAKLYGIYTKQEDWKNALHYHEKLSLINQEIYNEHSEKHIRNLEILHQVENFKENETKLTKKVAEQTVELQKLLVELELAYETTLEGWAQALELRDKETEGHSRRVTELSLSIGDRLGINSEQRKNLQYGALLHDIGKMGIPDEILNKQGPLTPEELLIMRNHPAYAYDLLKNIGYLQSVIVIPYSHHENWDGTGYPQGLKGEKIPLLARIFSIVDNWDALTSDRPYRKAWSIEKTSKYIQEESGKKFDPKIVKVFLGYINQKK
ncbi:MAG: tetratricopeptide repeat protein [Spirochaetaceae bacterium]|nr:tetratricopeptide repeat protein [Spirochaetaceae bacterium]